MAKNEDNLTRTFHVICDFDRFHKGEVVEGIMYPDYFAVEGQGKELRVPYSEIEYVAHCERPEGRVADMATGVPYAFGQSGLVSLVAETAASVAISGAEWKAAPSLMQNLFLVGYHDGSEEKWVLLQDTHTYATNAMAQGLAHRAHVKVTHYFAMLEQKADL